MFNLFKQLFFNPAKHEKTLSNYIAIRLKSSERPAESSGARYSERDNNDSGIKYSDRRAPLDNYDFARISALLSSAKTAQNKDAAGALNVRRNKTFVEEVRSIMYENGYQNVKVYKAAGIDRRLFSHMMSDSDYKPSKDTAIALAFALRQNILGATRLLERAGYSLSHSFARDIIFEYCFCNEIYDICNVNELLELMNEKPLN